MAAELVWKGRALSIATEGSAVTSGCEAELLCPPLHSPLLQAHIPTTWVANGGGSQELPSLRPKPSLWRPVATPWQCGSGPKPCLSRTLPAFLPLQSSPYSCPTRTCP